MLDKFIRIPVSTWVAVLALALIVVLTWSSRARVLALLALRILARPLLLVAIIALVYDGTRTLAGNSGLVTTSLAEHWQNLAPSSFAATKAFFDHSLFPWAWEGAVLKLLRLPAWLVLGGLGLIFSQLGRKRAGVNIFAN